MQEIMLFGSLFFGNEQLLESLHNTEKRQNQTYSAIFDDEKRYTAIENVRARRDTKEVQEAITRFKVDSRKYSEAKRAAREAKLTRATAQLDFQNSTALPTLIALVESWRAQAAEGNAATLI
jgi:hypothetical protein